MKLELIKKYLDSQIGDDNITVEKFQAFIKAEYQTEYHDQIVIDLVHKTFSDQSELELFIIDKGDLTEYVENHDFIEGLYEHALND